MRPAPAATRWLRGASRPRAVTSVLTCTALGQTGTPREPDDLWVPGIPMPARVLRHASDPKADRVQPVPGESQK